MNELPTVSDFFADIETASTRFSYTYPSKDFDTLPDVIMGWEANTHSGHLMLPNPDLTEMDDADHRYFRHIENEEQFRGLVEIYVLRTVTEALRLIHRLSRHVPLMRSLEFHNDLSFSNFRRPRWDILYLVRQAFWCSVKMICNEGTHSLEALMINSV